MKSLIGKIFFDIHHRLSKFVWDVVYIILVITPSKKYANVKRLGEVMFSLEK